MNKSRRGGSNDSLNFSHMGSVHSSEDADVLKEDYLNLGIKNNDQLLDNQQHIKSEEVKRSVNILRSVEQLRSRKMHPTAKNSERFKKTAQ